MLIYLKNKVTKTEFVELLDEALSQGKDFSFTPTGSSMLPMLDGVNDTVTLTRKPKKLKKYDVVLYKRRRDNALVLHRVIRVDGDSYTMSGDSQRYFDEDIPHCDILAVMKSFTHNSKVVSANSFLYKIYSRYILIKKYIRVMYSKIAKKIKK